MCLSLAQCGEPWLAQGESAFPSARHGCSANGDLIVAAVVIIRPTSPAPVPPALLTQTTSHTHSSVLSNTYTTHACLFGPRYLRLICLHYHSPPRHVNTPKSTICIPRVSPATATTPHQPTDNEPVPPSRPLASPPVLVHPLHNPLSRPIDLAANISISNSSPHPRLHSAPIPI
jgi:hypothetical protein